MPLDAFNLAILTIYLTATAFFMYFSRVYFYFFAIFDEFNKKTIHKPKFFSNKSYCCLFSHNIECN